MSNTCAEKNQIKTAEQPQSVKAVRWVGQMTSDNFSSPRRWHFKLDSFSLSPRLLHCSVLINTSVFKHIFCPEQLQTFASFVLFSTVFQVVCKYLLALSRTIYHQHLGNSNVWVIADWLKVCKPNSNWLTSSKVKHQSFIWCCILTHQAVSVKWALQR